MLVSEDQIGRVASNLNVKSAYPAASLHEECRI